MKITYLMINADVVCGGNRTVFGQINGLIERGHDVRVLALYGNKPFIPLKTEVINVPQFEGMIPQSDIVVAAFNIRALPFYHPKREIPFYLCLIYESLYSENSKHEELCDILYKAPMNLLCNSTWTQKVFKKKIHRHAYYVPDGIDVDLFKPKERLFNNDTKRVLMMYRGGRNKGLNWGLHALKIIKEKLPEVEVVMFGTDQLPKVDFPYTFFYNPSQEDLPKIYLSCSVLLFPSILEGFGLPRLEAMWCGCAVVTTDCFGGREFCIDQETALIVPKRNPKKIAEGVIKVLEDEPLRMGLIRKGYEKAQKFTLERSIDTLEDVFKRVEELKRKRSLEKMGRWEKVVATSPDDPWAHYQFGIELYKKGRRGDAEAEFKRAARLDPSFTLPQEAFSLLREGREDFPQDWESLEGSLVVKEKVIR
jgi:glycosyltransferase involved in cell wall biosynthesis